MIGLVGAIVASVILGSWIPLLAVIPYVSALKGRKAALFGFSLYILALLTSPGFDSVYTLEGQRELFLLGMPALLVLDDVLRGSLVPKGKTDAALIGLLALSALNDYSFFAALLMIAAYRLYQGFGKAGAYFLLWAGSTWVILILLRGKLPGVAGEAFVIGALGLTAIALGGLKDAEHAGVEM
ncbi:hypothetical protein [Thermococcus sp. Bubb.Bath]|uniref:hypothetical protein n=1 Tax=Thermococcus sp. Bubb.Bath TaxID=1638242 RepID=UPI00143C040E|nr:hypothetical protein [Thermococcus sp. Bubb.Bath]NJF25138.1 hypothetical protein [Thermococcus sp. Bubb.Bath]